MRPSPHDEFFRYLFSMTDAVRAILTEFLDKEDLDLLDLDSLAPDDTQYVTDELKKLFSDKVWRCRLKAPHSKKASAALPALLIEHKSRKPRYPYVQLADYRQRIHHIDLGNKRPPSAVIPLLVYNGSKPWGRHEMAASFEHIPARLHRYLGIFDYILIDLSQKSDDQIMKIKLGFAASGLLLMKHSKDKKYLIDQFHTLFQLGDGFLSSEAGRNFVGAMLVYYAKSADLSGENLKIQIETKLSGDMKTIGKSTYDQLIEEGIVIGEARGEARGRTETANAVAESLLLEFPGLSDAKVAALSKSTPESVAFIRARLILEGKLKPTE
jgi:Putative transposase, YhgA-like